MLQIAPLLAPSENYYSGLFFELHAPPRSGTAAAVLAAGGRYDALLSAAWPQGSDAGPPGGVGVSFSLSRLSSLVSAPSASTLDVLIAARGGGGLLRQRVELVAQLWAAGIRAETLPQTAPSLTEQYAYATARRARFLVILSADSAVVRLKHMMSGAGRAAGREDDVPRADIVRILAAGGVASLAEEPTPADSDAGESADEGARKDPRGGRRRRFAANADRRTSGGGATEH
jgi:translation initiation factor 2-alpha kinase 4